MRKSKILPFICRIRIHIYFCDPVPLKACANVLRIGCWLPGVISDSPHYDTLGLPAVSYPREIFYAKFELFCENIITQDRMMKKTVCRKSRWNVPLNRIRKNHMTPRSMITRGDWLHAVCHTPGRFRKVWTTRRNLNQNRKYFNPLVSGPGKFEWWKSLNVENRGRLSL